MPSPQPALSCPDRPLSCSMSAPTDTEVLLSGIERSSEVRPLSPPSEWEVQHIQFPGMSSGTTEGFFLFVLFSFSFNFLFHGNAPEWEDFKNSTQTWKSVNIAYSNMRHGERIITCHLGKVLSLLNVPVLTLLKKFHPKSLTGWLQVLALREGEKLSLPHA